MGDPDPRIAALEIRQKAADQELAERRLLELKRNAITLRLLEEKADQASLWRTLTNVADDAALTYMDMRMRGLEARLDAKDADQGMPMWMSLAIAVGLSFIPVTAITNALLGAMAVGTQRVMRRAMRVVTKKDRAAIRALGESAKRGADEEFLTWLRRATLDRKAQLEVSRAHAKVLKKLREAEQSVADFYKAIEPEVSNQAQEWAKAVLDSAGEVLFNVLDRDSKVDATEAPVVVVRRSVVMQFEDRQRDEDAARRVYASLLEKTYADATEYIEVGTGRPRVDHRDQKERERRRSDARALIHQLYKEEFGSDQYQPFEAAPPLQFIPASDFPDLQRVLEMMMWATTFDFKLQSVQHFQSGTRNDYVWKPQITDDWGLKRLPDTLETIPLPDEMWKILLERYIDPDTKKPYAQSRDARTLGTTDNPASSDAFTKNYPQPLYTPKHRFSYFMSMILAPELEKEIKRVGTDLYRIHRARAAKR